METEECSLFPVQQKKSFKHFQSFHHEKDTPMSNDLAHLTQLEANNVHSAEKFFFCSDLSFPGSAGTKQQNHEPVNAGLIFL